VLRKPHSPAASWRRTPLAHSAQQAAGVLLAIVFVGQLFPITGLAQSSHRLIPPTVVNLASSEIAHFEENPPAVRNLLQSALDLARRDLGYLFGSASPANRGMDCSGTIFYLLTQAGVRSVPRSSQEIYRWVLAKSKFHAVNSNRLDSEQLRELHPGDLLFWTGTYTLAQPNIVSHTMIYLGRAKSDGLQLMVGASDGRTYRGKNATVSACSIFAFQVRTAEAASSASPQFQISRALRKLSGIH